VRAAGASPTSAQLPRTTSARESPAQARNQGLTLTTLMPEGPEIAGQHEKTFIVADPACGTGTFLVSAFEWRQARERLELEGDASDANIRIGYRGQEVATRPRRLALMNLYLHGIDGTVAQLDAISEPAEPASCDVILTKPPFSSFGARSVPGRPDFAVRTADTALNFTQHCVSMLKPGGRCAIVVPDSALLTNEGCEVMRSVMAECDVHTVLRCPRGTFPPDSPGFKASVLFFSKGETTGRTWIYDGRTNVAQVTARNRPLADEHFSDFGRCFRADPNGSASRVEDDSREGRWKMVTSADVAGVGYNFAEFQWLVPSSEDELGSVQQADDFLSDAESALVEAMHTLDDLRRFISDLASPR
jgi:type I restriction enzyme M protein